MSLNSTPSEEELDPSSGSYFWYLEADGADRVTQDCYGILVNDEDRRDFIMRDITTVEQEKRNEDDRKKNVYKHVPHKDRPPLIVARRNARERRRVQAVNSAFTRLRKVVPIVHNRGKRISKVKTLQTAIDYISGLQALLKETEIYDYHNELDIISNYRYRSEDFTCVLENFENEF